jgi:replicative DNA helicase
VDAPTGITSGMPKVDSVTGGWQPSDLIILAARPGMGKTALALAWIQSAAEDGTPVLFFSMEMSKEQCFGRMVGRATRIQHKAFRGHMSDEEKERLMSNSASDLLELPIFVDDTPAQNINTMRAKAKLWSAQHPSGLIVADYLQLANAGRDNKVHDVTDVSEGFKAMAKENNVPVIALSQLSRKVEERAVKVPMLSDLRESGGIEQAADAVLFIYRPSYYGLEQDPQGNHVLPNYAELDFAKHRNGALDTLALSFYGEHMDWRDETKYQ